MVKFIYGNPGTGKTELIFSYLSEDATNGKKAILIVPEQMTVSSERELIKRLPASAQLKIEVLNFSRLANRIFREQGGLAYNFASPALQKLMMWQALRTALPFLSEYRLSQSNDYALSDAMLATYKEITACGISFESLENAVTNTNSSVLTNKIKDITTVCSIYSSMLSDKYTDTNNELSRLADLLDKKNCLNGINVYIDGFTSFTGLEHRIIRSMMTQAESLTITVGISSPSSSGIDTLSLKQCSDRLRRDCASCGVKVESIILNENRRAKYRELAFLSSDLWEMCNSFKDNDTDSNDYPIRLYRAADIYDECEFAAAEVRKLIQKGYRYKDIAIIARNADKYRGIIEPALDNMEIRYFISEKVDLSISPIARLIISALRIASYGWRRSDVIAHLKTGLCNVTPHDSDVFEFYTAKWNISGKSFLNEDPWNMNPDGYTTTISEKGAQILEIANAVKNKLIGQLKVYVSELRNSETYAQACAATLRYLEALDVHGAMLRLSSKYLSNNKTREASDSARMYEIAIDALECVCDAFPDYAKPDLNTFENAIRIAFAESNLGSIPTSQDEVIIGSANMLRTENIKCAIILGACDGEFPANAESTGLLSDQDREILITQGIHISGDRQMSASDELYYFRRAVSSPSEKLIVFTRADSEPSIAFTRINKLICADIHETTDLLRSRLISWQAASEYAPILQGTAEGEALVRLLDEAGKRHKNDVEIKISADEDTIDQELVKMAVGTDMRLSQSKIELFSNCKFAYSCKYFLSLDEGQQAEFAYNNIGTFIHHILEKFLFFVFITNKGVFPTDCEKEQLINGIIEDYVNEILPDRNHKSARLLHLIDRLKSTSSLIIDDLLSEFSDSSFKPEYFELKIGTREIPSIRLTLKNGTKVSLNGIIDRVDVFRKDGKAYIRVVDYKTGSKTFSVADISEGLNLQLLLYIFSLTKQNTDSLSELFGGIPTPAAITYLSSSSPKVKAKRIDDPDASMQSAANEIKRTGLILGDDEIVNALSHSGNDRILLKSSRKNSFIDSEGLDLLYKEVCTVLSDIGNEMISGNINARPKQDREACKYCRYELICRASKK